MQKKKLTEKIIKKDLSFSIFCDILHAIRYIFPIILILIILLSLPDSTHFSRIMITVILGVPSLVLSFLVFYIDGLKYTHIHNDKFQIVKAKLINYKLKEYYHWRYDSYRPLTFHFEKHGKYRIFKNKYYKYSLLTSMNDRDILESSFIGDEFYLVLVKNKIVYVYNTKLFELQEEIN